MIDAKTGEPVVITGQCPMPATLLHEPARPSPIRVLAYLAVVTVGLMLGAFAGLVGLILFGGIMFC